MIQTISYKSQRENGIGQVKHGDFDTGFRIRVLDSSRSQEVGRTKDVSPVYYKIAEIHTTGLEHLSDSALVMHKMNKVRAFEMPQRNSVSKRSWGPLVTASPPASGLVATPAVQVQQGIPFDRVKDSIKSIGAGLYKAAYDMGEDYGTIWKRVQLPNEITGEIEDWLVKYSDDDDVNNTVLRNVIASLEGKEAEMSAYDPDYYGASPDAGVVQTEITDNIEPMGWEADTGDQGEESIEEQDEEDEEEEQGIEGEESTFGPQTITLKLDPESQEIKVDFPEEEGEGDPMGQDLSDEDKQWMEGAEEQLKQSPQTPANLTDKNEEVPITF